MSVAGPPPAAPDNVLRGILVMVVAVSLFPFMNAAVKWLSADYPVNQLVWARYAGHLAFCLLLFLPMRGRRLFRSRRPALQYARSTLLMLSSLSFTTAIIFIPLATASAIGFTAPLVVTALSVPLLAERVGPRRWAAVAVGFAGAVLIIRPGSDSFHWAMLLMLGNAGIYALYQLLTRRIAPHDDAVTTISYTAVVGTVALSLTLPFSFVVPAEPLHWLLFAWIGLIGGLSHYLVVLAFRSGPAAVISPLGYVELVTTTAVAFALFGELPDEWTFAGAGVIIACGLFIAYREAKVKAGAT